MGVIEWLETTAVMQWLAGLSEWQFLLLVVGASVVGHRLRAVVAGEVKE